MGQRLGNVSRSGLTYACPEFYRVTDEKGCEIVLLETGISFFSESGSKVYRKRTYFQQAEGRSSLQRERERPSTYF
jgi:hypothetical protein